MIDAYAGMEGVGVFSIDQRRRDLGKQQSCDRVTSDVTRLREALITRTLVELLHLVAEFTRPDVLAIDSVERSLQAVKTHTVLALRIKPPCSFPVYTHSLRRPYLFQTSFTRKHHAHYDLFITHTVVFLYAVKLLAPLNPGQTPLRQSGCVFPNVIRTSKPCD